MSGPLIRLALKLLIWFHEKNDQCYGILDKNVISQKEWIEMLTAGVAIKKKLLFGVGSDSSANYFSSEVTSILVTTKYTTAIIAIISVSKKTCCD